MDLPAKIVPLTTLIPMEESKIKPWILSETMLSGIYGDYQKLPDEGTHWIMMINVVLIFILVVL